MDMQTSRYSPIRQKAPFIVSSENRVRGPSLPYMFRNNDGASAFSSAGTGYSHRSVPGIPSHMVSLLPTGYPSRSVDNSYNVISSVGSRPRVLPVHTFSVGAPNNVRHYPITRSQVEVKSTTPHSQNSDASGLYRSTPMSGSTGENISLLTTTRNSIQNTHSAQNVFPSPVSQSLRPPLKEKVDGSTLPALCVQPPSLASLSSLDPNAELMTSGLKLQQKWIEKDELKNLFSSLANLIRIINCICVCGENFEVAWKLCEGLRTLIEKRLPQDLSRLKQRIGNMVCAQNTMDLDIGFISDNIESRLKLVSQLRDTELVKARNNLTKAKRRRYYHQELEAVSAEILTKKPQQVFKKEIEQEGSKLREAEESLVRWKRIGHLRKTQVDCILLYIRDMLQSLKDPISFLNLVDAPENSTEQCHSNSSDALP